MLMLHKMLVVVPVPTRMFGLVTLPPASVVSEGWLHVDTVDPKRGMPGHRIRHLSLHSP